MYPPRKRGNNSRKKLSLSMFDIGKKIGEGKFGHVFLVKERSSNFVCALKIIKKKDISKTNTQRQLRREIEIHARLNHPNIIRLYNYFWDSERIYLIIEYAHGGEVYHHLRKQKRFSEEKSARFIYQIASALEYCHQRKVIHRDIKPENLLMDMHGNIKICDFGMSVFSPNDSRRNTLCGTLDYLAPEMVEKRSHNQSIDSWCLGVLLYEFLVGKTPFETADIKKTYKRIRDCELRFPIRVSTEARDLVSRLLIKKSQERLTARQVLQHPFIRKYCRNM